MQNSAAAIGLDPFAEERKEYERTIGDLFNELAESKRYCKVAMEELFNKLAESEQDRTASAERMLIAEEERRLAEEGRRSAEEDLRARIQRDHTTDFTSSDLPNSFSKEREDYLKTIEELYDRVLRLEQRRTESMKAEERRPIAECDYLAQIQKAQEFEELYNAEKRKRESIEEELARCKEEAMDEHDDEVTEEEAKKPIEEHDKVAKEEGEDLLDWVICE